VATTFMKSWEMGSSSFFEAVREHRLVRKWLAGRPHTDNFFGPGTPPPSLTRRSATWGVLPHGAVPTSGSMSFRWDSSSGR
jgi:hypothetical protein